MRQKQGVEDRILSKEGSKLLFCPLRGSIRESEDCGGKVLSIGIQTAETVEVRILSKRN